MSSGRARLRRHRMNVEHASILADTLLSTPKSKLTGGRSAEGDAARLRGIPAIGRGVSGAIPGTHPELATMNRLAVDDLSPDDPPFFRKVLTRPEPDPRTEARVARYEIRRARSMLRQARTRGATDLERVTRQEIIDRDEGTCYLCGKRCDPAEIHIDHIVPASRGGSHRADNLAVACAVCNISKGDRPTEKRPPALSGKVASPAEAASSAEG